MQKIFVEMIVVKKILFLIISFILIFNLTGCSEDKKVEKFAPEVKKVETKQIQTENITPQPKQYDKLQNLFLQITFNTTASEIENYISSNGLQFTKQEYNGTPRHIDYRIAYVYEVALQKRGQSGDYVIVSFDKSTGSFMSAEYFNDTTYGEALNFRYGTHWELIADNPNNDKSGYYVKFIGKMDSKYQKIFNAEQAIDTVVDKT